MRRTTRHRVSLRCAALKWPRWKRLSALSSLCLGAGLVLAAPASSLPAAGEHPPARVMSLNVCTDQLATALAAPGQPISVSFLARDPAQSAMPEEAEAYPLHHGRAEEVF